MLTVLNYETLSPERRMIVMDKAAKTLGLVQSGEYTSSDLYDLMRYAAAGFYTMRSEYGR